MGHTEHGSYVVPILLPLTPTKQVSATPRLDDGADVFAYAIEPPERRVTRTFAQALAAVDEVIVKGDANPTVSDLHPVIAVGGCREIIVALERILKDPAVASLEASFSWAGGLQAPSGVPERVSIEANAVPRLEAAARKLKTTHQLPAEIITGPIVEIRHVPGDTFGEISIDTTRRSRRCEVRITLSKDDLDRTYEWARTERAVLAQGQLHRDPGKPLRMLVVDRLLPLDESFLPGIGARSAGNTDVS
jgi:hypothetical protein